eukprot:gnl/Carplike_NY0171/5614_a7689_157.p1 GENE.gnl/Carplike_NY0171/5614_a7689_157~~gnl/Carplike_NY0171/5614_a7689_157.p1  ORF type:complete len:420 (-),score=140.12 gnl/Carplike_NY0171/5614_a7689_157:100-1170(-)
MMEDGMGGHNGEEEDEEEDDLGENSFDFVEEPEYFNPSFCPPLGTWELHCTAYLIPDDIASLSIVSHSSSGKLFPQHREIEGEADEACATEEHDITEPEEPPVLPALPLSASSIIPRKSIVRAVVSCAKYSFVMPCIEQSLESVHSTSSSNKTVAVKQEEEEDVKQEGGEKERCIGHIDKGIDSIVSYVPRLFKSIRASVSFSMDQYIALLIAKMVQGAKVTLEDLVSRRSDSDSSRVSQYTSDDKKRERDEREMEEGTIDPSRAMEKQVERDMLKRLTGGDDLEEKVEDENCPFVSIERCDISPGNMCANLTLYLNITKPVGSHLSISAVANKIAIIILQMEAQCAMRMTNYSVI